MSLSAVVRSGIFAVALVLAQPVLAQSAADHLGVPGPVQFQGVDFGLAWTSNPSPTYFKQEYVPAGQKVEAYQDMFLIEAVTAGITPAAAASGMVEQLKQRKAGGDPLVNYEIVSNPDTGEILLDFLLSDSSTGTLIVEWNAYRYTALGGGKDGIALYAISRRGYGDQAKDFLGGLKTMRPAAIAALAKMAVPTLKPTP